MSNWLNPPPPKQVVYLNHMTSISYCGGCYGVEQMNCPDSIGYVYSAYPDVPGFGGFACSIGGALSGAISALQAFNMRTYAGHPQAASIEHSILVLGGFSSYSQGSYQIWAKGVVEPIIKTKNIDKDKGEEKDKGKDKEKDKGDDCANNPPSTSAGNPIDFASGNKFQVETDYRSPNDFGLSYTRFYNSSTSDSFRHGGNWSASYSQKLVFHPASDSSTSSFIEAWRPTGRKVRLTLVGTDWKGEAGDTLTLTQTTSGWLLKTETDSFETYNPSGLLISIVNKEGMSKQLEYDASQRLSKVTDSSGRSITFSYDAATGLVSQIFPVGSTSSDAISFSYSTSLDFAKLLKVKLPDLKERQYLYENSSYPMALTGLRDENGIRFASWNYDDSGLAYSSVHANGVDAYTVSRNENSVSVTDPLGSTRVMEIQSPAGIGRVAVSSQPAGSGCAASSSRVTYDGNARMLSRDDFQGNRSCYTNDQARNLVVRRIDGLSSADACPADGALTGVLPAPARVVSTQWHPDWPVRTKVAVPGRIVTNVYNGQPDPFNGNAIASCAPPTALLPDGKPIVVLCKKVYQATSDTNGSLGFDAPLDASMSARQSKWTYNQFGQVLTEDGPRTDVADVTSYEYYADTTADHTLGDLKQVTNARGKITQYTKYNKHGQVLESIDPNAVLTVHTYDLRQRLLSTSVGGQKTSYTYDAAGQLKRITQPNATYIGFDYDDAHRLVATYDNKGNRIQYTLDNAGNRIGEQVKDPAGVLKRQLSRSIDALGRVQQVAGRE